MGSEGTMKKDYVNFNFSYPKKDHEKLRKIAFKKKTSIRHEIREAIRARLEGNRENKD